MILPSHYALLADAADAVAINGIIGEPTKERKATGKARARDERGRFIKQADTVDTALADERRVESVPVERNANDLDEAYRETFAALSTAKMEDLLTGSNERLDSLLSLISDWWAWDMKQVQALNNEGRKRKRIEDLEQLHDRQRLKQSQQTGGTGSGHPLDPLFDSIFGEGDPFSRRKRDTKRRRTPVKKQGMFRRMGGKLLSGLSTVGKVGALAATGALGYVGLSKAAEHAPAPPAVELDAPDTKTPDVKRTAAEAADVPEVRNAEKAAKAAKAEKGIFSKLGGFGKIGGVLGGLLTAGLVANEAVGIRDNDTMTDKEKDREYSKLGGNAMGSVVGGAGGAWAGAQGGAAAGALIGSVVPVLGTAVGAAVGTAVGAVLGGGVGSYFGSDAGEEAGSMVYDIVVRDDQVKDDDEHKVQAELKSPDLEKIAKATESPSAPSWWQRLLGGGATPTVGNYAQGGGGGFLSSFGYGGSRGNAVPRAGSPSQKLDYRIDPNYVAGQGVLKNLPTNSNQEAQLSRWSNLIEEKATARGVDPLLVRSVMKQESGGNAAARSPTGVEGLMQLTQMTAREVGVRDRRDPEQSIDGGAAYLAKQIKAFGGNVPLALAAYNGGAGNINKAIKHAGSNDPEKVLASLPYVMNDQAKVREIQGYVNNITKYHKEYQDQAKAMAPSEGPVTSNVERDKLSTEVAVPRTDTANNILTQTTPPPPAIAAPVAEKKGKRQRDQSESRPSRRASAPPTSIAQGGGQDPTSLDDMPLLLTDHGLGSILIGRI